MVYCATCLTYNTMALPGPGLAEGGSSKLSGSHKKLQVLKRKGTVNCLPQQLKACSLLVQGSDLTDLFSHYTANFKLHHFVISVARWLSFVLLHLPSPLLWVLYTQIWGDRILSVEDIRSHGETQSYDLTWHVASCSLSEKPASCSLSTWHRVCSPEWQSWPSEQIAFTRALPDL